MSARVEQLRRGRTGRSAERERAATTEDQSPSIVPAGWHLIGWQAITVAVPGDWNLGAIGGEHKSGYLRVDDAERPRLEIKWSESSVDMERVLTKYFKQLEKKSKCELTIDREAKVISRRAKPKKKIRGFTWESDQRAAGVIWHCGTCKRTVIAQVLGKPGEQMLPLARQVLVTLDDHPRGGRATWAAYGLVFETPSSFVLESQKLMAGLLEFRFLDKRRRVGVWRWGMAGTALAQSSLEDFARAQYRPRRDVRWKVTDTEAGIKGHKAIRLTGHRRRRLHGTRKLMEGAIGLRLANELSAVLWHCAESNRIYGVESLEREGGTVLEEVVSSVACHSA